MTKQKRKSKGISNRLNYWLTGILFMLLITFRFGSREMSRGEIFGYGKAFLYGIFLVSMFVVKTLVDKSYKKLWVNLLTMFVLIFLFSVSMFYDMGGFLNVLFGSFIFSLVITAITMLIPLLIEYFKYTDK